jgi:hypothetical protein
VYVSGGILPRFATTELDTWVLELIRSAWSRFGIPNVLHISDQDIRTTDYVASHLIDATSIAQDPDRSELRIPKLNEAERKAESARLRDPSRDATRTMSSTATHYGNTIASLTKSHATPSHLRSATEQERLSFSFRYRRCQVVRQKWTWSNHSKMN